MTGPRMLGRTVGLVASLPLIVMGCAVGPTRSPVAVAPAHPEPVADGAAPTTVETVPPLRDSGTLHFSKSVRTLCAIPDHAAPNFRYDSATLRDSDQPELVRLAACMRSGAMVNYDILLVGHADPRGSEEYNLALGGHRAASVRQFLIDHGVSESRIITSSRGELDASGDSAATYLLDRRVDLMLPGER